MLSDDVAVVESARRAIERLHSLGIGYASIFAPLHDAGMQDLLRLMTVTARGENLGGRDLEAVAPPIFGRYVLLYSTDVDDRRRRFAVRHGLGHVVAGHVTHPVYLSLDRNDHMSHEERVCDLFALADLTPAAMVEDLRGAEVGWRAINEDICRQVRHYTLDWPQTRVTDRAMLRLRLYRQHGL